MMFLKRALKSPMRRQLSLHACAVQPLNAPDAPPSETASSDGIVSDATSPCLVRLRSNVRHQHSSWLESGRSSISRNSDRQHSRCKADAPSGRYLTVWEQCTGILQKLCWCSGTGSTTSNLATLVLVAIQPRYRPMAGLYRK
jgi:hypothetical protein